MTKVINARGGRSSFAAAAPGSFESSNKPIFVMTAFIVMIFISLLVALGFLAAFIWSVRKGQYDDDYTPSVRILLDDTDAKP